MPRRLRSAAELIAAYDTHVDTVTRCASVRFARRGGARRFVDRFPDPAVWMRRPTPARLTDLHRLKAWPFVSWCFVQRHLVADVELLLAKPAGCGLPVEWAEHEPDNLAAVAEAAAVLGWSSNWQRQVGLLAASTICLHVGKLVRQLTQNDFADVLGQHGWIGGAVRLRVTTPAPAVRLAEACYQLGSLTTRRGKAGGWRSDHCARYRVRQPLIRTEMVRYVQTITTTPRLDTVGGWTKALRGRFDQPRRPLLRGDRLEQIETDLRHRAVPGMVRTLSRGAGKKSERRAPSAWSCSTKTWSILRGFPKTLLGGGAGHRTADSDACSSTPPDRPTR